MVVKYFEYSAKVEHGLFPGFGLWNPDMEYVASHLRSDAGFDIATVDPANLRLFFVLYFAMTGLHGIHIVIGIGLMFWLMKRLKETGTDIKIVSAGMTIRVGDEICYYILTILV